jgi:ribosomal protein S18 acetylase RimI-like enzyme
MTTALSISIAVRRRHQDPAKTTRSGLRRARRIIDIAFLPAQRGKGFGDALLRDLMDEAAAAGQDVSIHVEKFNPAMRLYQRLGFATQEDKGVYDLMRWTAARD